ncbi:MAG: family N-acetyltransferase [Alphaproteobacteria bacterium]|nr:family N-acetyltransferase [Alphaproteobacteria bacterium]
MTISPATQADLPEVVALMNCAYRGSDGWAAEGGYIKGDRVRLDDLQAELAAGLPLFVWREEGALLGCYSLEKSVGDTFYVGMLTVDPGRQDAQLGRRLLAEAENRARNLGATRMEMTVIWMRDKLIGWYQRRGYVATGETRPFPYGDDRWGVPTRDDLHFVVLEKLLA